MGLHIKLPYPKEYRDKRDKDDVEVILHSTKSDHGALEIVGLDITAAMAGQAMGLPFYDPELAVYNEYVKNGLEGLIKKDPSTLYWAFKEQGYDVFEEPYSADEFLNEIGQNLRDYEGNIEDYIYVLNKAVKNNEYEKKEFVEDLIEGLKKFAELSKESEREEAWEEQARIEGKEDDALLYLYQLKELLPKTAFKLVPEDLWSDYGDIDETDWHLGYYVEINKEYITDWELRIIVRIVDPVTLETRNIDPCSDQQYESSDWCPPYIAELIMNAMMWYYPEVELPEQDIPESDEDGLFAVEYIDSSSSKRKRHFIRYETLKEANDAAELSKELLFLQGQGDDYTITVFAYDKETNQWTQVEED